MPGTATPTAPPPPPQAKPADLLRSFLVYPTAGEGGCYEVRVIAEDSHRPTGPRAAAMDEVQKEARSVCEKQLRGIVADYFTSGAGKNYRDLQQRFTEIEATKRENETELAELREKLRGALTEIGGEVAEGAIEAAIEIREKQVQRVLKRIAVLGEEIGRIRAEVVADLRAKLVAHQHKFAAAAAKKAEAARAELAAAVNTKFVEWLHAATQQDGANNPGMIPQLLAAV